MAPVFLEFLWEYMLHAFTKQALPQNYDNIHLTWPVPCDPELALPLRVKGKDRKSFLLSPADQSPRNVGTHRKEVAGTLIQFATLVRVTR